jgi:hypothetical protein
MDNFTVRFIITALAVYTFAHAFAVMTGPFAIFDRAREWLIARYGYKSWQAEFSRCPICQSFWLGLIAAALMFPFSFTLAGIVEWGVIGAALSCVTIMLHLTLYRT